MSTLHLFIISPRGTCTEFITGYELCTLIAACEEHLKKYPHLRFGIADERGTFIWPEETSSLCLDKQNT
jgi:hypothetical protein